MNKTELEIELIYLKNELERHKKNEEEFFKIRAELQQKNNTLNRENIRLSTRIDACLYSMVLLQGVIRKSVDKEEEKKYEFKEGSWIALAQ